MSATKRNIVEGVNHLGTFLQALPLIATYINANYNEDAFIHFYNSFIEYEFKPTATEDDIYKAGQWVLKGTRLNFIIQFEQTEMLFFWHVKCPTEEVYSQTKVHFERILIN